MVTKFCKNYLYIFINDFSDGTYEELAPFFFDDVAPRLPSKLSMLVKDGDKAVGFNLVDYVEKEDFGKYFTNGTPMENPVLEIKDDYAEGVLHFLSSFASYF